MTAHQPRLAEAMSESETFVAPSMYAEDFPPGAVFALGSYNVTEAEIVEFARQWDPLPIHTHSETAQRSSFGGLVASGVHVLGIFQRLHVEALLGRTAVVAGRGTRELWLRAPTRGGDILTASVEFVENSPRRRRGDAAVTLRGTMVNQHGTLVFEMLGELLIQSRTGPSAEG